MSDATIWEGPSANIPVVNADGNIFEEVQVATAAQTIFTLTSFQYTPGAKCLWVLRKTGAAVGSEMLRRGVDFTETSSTQITLAAGATAGDIFIFIAFAIQQLIPPTVFNGIPQGGSAGQILTKTSGSDFAASWQSPGNITTLLDSPRVNVASASTINLAAIAATTRNIQITGGIQIDGFQVTNGQVWVVRFGGALTLKSNANIVTQSGKDIKTAVGDTCILRATADNVVEVVSYARNSASVAAIVNDFRLTLSSGVPVTIADVTSANVYMTPYIGNRISLYNGVSWETLTTAEISYNLAGLTANLPYDVFCYNNAGVPTLEIVAWSSISARATALVKQDNVYVKSGDATRRYIGTFSALTANSTCDTLSRRLLWNYYNRVNRSLIKGDPTGSWNYTTSAYRVANGNSANCVVVCVGVDEDTVEVNLYSAMLNNTGGLTVDTAIGLDGLAPAANSIIGSVNLAVNKFTQAISRFTGSVGIGYHALYWLETSPVVGVTTWYGGNSAGLHGSCRC